MSSLTLLDRVVADKNIDEQAWLAARRRGVTATDIRELEKNSDSKRDQILRDKVYGSRFHGNAYTQWGLEREAVIAEWVAENFGHQPSDVTFHAPNNHRFLATPDGLHIKDGIVTICEIKTSKHDLTPGTDAFINSHYMAQCQWQMMVAGDDVMECLFVYEIREGDEGVFTPGERKYEWIERDNGHIAELVGIAEQFLEDLDNYVQHDPNDYVWLLQELNRVDKRLAEWEENRKRIVDEILERIGDVPSFYIETSAGKISYTTPKPTTRFDSVAFKAAHPDLYRLFTKTTQSKPSLRITTPKEVESDVF